MIAPLCYRGNDAAAVQAFQCALDDPDTTHANTMRRFIEQRHTLLTDEALATWLALPLTSYDLDAATVVFQHRPRVCPATTADPTLDAAAAAAGARDVGWLRRVLLDLAMGRRNDDPKSLISVCEAIVALDPTVPESVAATIGSASRSRVIRPRILGLGATWGNLTVDEIAATCTAVAKARFRTTERIIAARVARRLLNEPRGLTDEQKAVVAGVIAIAETPRGVHAGGVYEGKPVAPAAVGDVESARLDRIIGKPDTDRPRADLALVAAVARLLDVRHGADHRGWIDDARRLDDAYGRRPSSKLGQVLRQPSLL